MMTVNSRPIPRSTRSALTRLGSCVALSLALPTAVWGQVDERDEAQRILYVGLKAGYESSTPWSVYVDEDNETPFGLDGLWLVTGERRWGVGVAATYTRLGFGWTMPRQPPPSSLADIPDLDEVLGLAGRAVVLNADALGTALVLGRSGRVWTFYGGAGFSVVSAGAPSVDNPGMPQWLSRQSPADSRWMTESEYEQLLRDAAIYYMRDRNPTHYAWAAWLRDYIEAERYDSIGSPESPDYDGLYVTLGVLRGKPRGFGYGLTIDYFGTGTGLSFSVANVTLGWKF